MGERNWEEHDPDERHDKRSGADGDEVTRRSRIEQRPNRAGRGTRLSAVVFAFGLWVLVEPLLFGFVPARTWNAILVGSVFVLAGAYNYYRRSNEELGSAGVAAFAAVAALWLAASPILLGPEAGLTAAASEIGAAVDVAVGLLVAGISIYSTYAIRERRRTADPRAAATYDRRGQ